MVLPAVMFIFIVFLAPIGAVLFRAVDGGAARVHFPNAAAVLGDWQRDTPVPEAAAAALARDLRAIDTATVADVARELNNRISGFRSLLLLTKRQVDAAPDSPASVKLNEIDERWADDAYWRSLADSMRPLTAHYVLAALDLRQNDHGQIERAAEDRRIYLDFIGRTFWICFVVTLSCALIGYPVAYVIANSSPRVAQALIFVLLLPFWTSVLVRTAAWVILLQPNGIVNSTLTSIGFAGAPLTLIYNRFGVYVAMIHVLLPFMILPIYSVMKSIPRNLMPAAASLGATPYASFRSVFLPLSMPGLAAGCLMTFVLGLGFYVTPALVGGPTDQMESGLIARFALDEANWQMASAIATVLLVMTTLTLVALIRLLRLRGTEIW